MALKVYVGMSGGVDSSVSAALLKAAGYDVMGVYMKNWTQDLPGMKCPWADDLADAKRVAVQLDIPFKVYDFQTEYKHKVVDYMTSEYAAGRTPNPDIMCNQEVKFKLFLETALADGAEMIATGHYARVADFSPEGGRAVRTTPVSLPLSAIPPSHHPHFTSPFDNSFSYVKRSKGSAKVRVATDGFANPEVDVRSNMGN